MSENERVFPFPITQQEASLLRTGLLLMGQIDTLNDETRDVLAALHYRLAAIQLGLEPADAEARGVARDGKDGER